MTASRIVIAMIVLVAIAVAPATATGPVASQQAPETACSGTLSYPITVTDATGTDVAVAEAPASVVALAPSDARTVYRIGAQDRLVGLPYSNATKGLDRGDRANVGSGFTVNTERIIDLDPDVVLAANVTKQAAIEKLRAANITVYHFRAARSIADVERNVRVTGALVGDCDGATETAEWMDRRLAIVDRAVEGVDRPLAFYALSGGYTAGNNTFQHEVLQRAGLQNLGASAGLEGWQPINTEVVIAQDPDWIVFPGSGTPSIPDAATSISAYQNERFVPVDANNVSQPAPQVVSAIEEIVQTVHSDAYQAALDGGDTTASEPNASETTEEGTNSNSTTESGDSTDAVPGFGVAGAIAAVLGASGLLARKR